MHPAQGGVPVARRKRKRTAASGPVPVGEALAGVFAGLGLDPAAAAQRARLQSLWEHWEAVMGPDSAPLARPLGTGGICCLSARKTPCWRRICTI